MKIVALEPIGIDNKKYIEIKNKFSELGHDFIFYKDRQENEEILINRAHNADVIILSNIPLSKKFIDSCQNLKYISVAFTGFDHIDTKYCREKNIIVSNAAGFSTHAVSELTIGIMLDVLRKISENEKACRNLESRINFTGNELFGKTVGIVGTGLIGIKVAEILKAFACNIIAYSRTEKNEVKKMGVKYCSLQKLMATSDIISLHLPLNKSTKHLIGKNEINSMKSNAILINTARGLIVDNNALAKALKNNKIAGAGIDIYEMEPPLPADYPLLSAPNTVLLPHIAFHSNEAADLRIDIVIENIIQWFNGNLIRVVN